MARMKSQNKNMQSIFVFLGLKNFTQNKLDNLNIKTGVFNENYLYIYTS